jgi:ribosomal-protein-serine acetyltransferase
MFTYELGQGTTLRILEMHHAQELLALVKANRAFFGRWLGWAVDMNTVEGAEAFISRGIARFAEYGLPRIGIWEDDAMVGGILFSPRESRIQATKIGYWLGESATGRGLMTRAIRALLPYLFDELGLNRIGLEVELDNTPSRALAERLGFVFEGVRRQGWRQGEQFVDIAVYSLLADEWRAATMEGKGTGTPAA